MRLHQLKVDYDAEQTAADAVATSEGVELRLALTRRFVKLLWPLLVKLPEASPRIRTQANPEARKALLGLEHEHAVSKRIFEALRRGAERDPRSAKRRAARAHSNRPRPERPAGRRPASLGGQGVTLTFDSVLLHSYAACPAAVRKSDGTWS